MNWLGKTIFIFVVAMAFGWAAAHAIYGKDCTYERSAGFVGPVSPECR